MFAGTIRRPLRAACVSLLGLTMLVGAGCATDPPPPSGPTVNAALAAAPGMFSSVAAILQGSASNFPGAGEYAVSWVSHNTGSSAVVSTGTYTAFGTDPPQFQKGIAFDKFAVSTNGPTSSVSITVELTMSRGGASATGTTSGTFSWQTPSSPITGDLTVTQGGQYQLTYITPPICQPVGSTITVSTTVASEPTSTFLLDLDGQFGATAQPITSGSSVALITTSACHSVVVLRASFTGLTGSSSYSIDW